MGSKQIGFQIYLTDDEQQIISPGFLPYFDSIAQGSDRYGSIVPQVIANMGQRLVDSIKMAEAEYRLGSINVIVKSDGVFGPSLGWKASVLGKQRPSIWKQL